MTTPVFASAVEAYHRAGWPAILPVPPEAKWPPPAGYTGEHGADTTPQQLAVWAANGYRDHSIALRMPDGIIGIDVDDYIKGAVTKTGLVTLAAKVADWGPLPETWCSTARATAQGPVHGGILFFRVPPGRYATTLGPDVEIIQRHHRYAVVAPSWNPDAGQHYRWYRRALLHQTPSGTPADIGDVPRPNDLPWAPDTWIEGLRAGATEAGPAPADQASGEHLLAVLTHDERKPCADVADALDQTDVKLSATDAGARHDTMTARVHRLIHLGASGHPGLGHALARLRTQWRELTAGEDRQAEFDRMLLTSARKAVTAVGPVPVDRDPCLLLGGFTVPAPAPIDDRHPDGTGQAPLPGPVGEPIPYSWRHVIGTHPFDPAADLDQTLAADVLARAWPMLRHAADTKNGWLQRGPTHWELHGDLTRRAVAEVAGLMPKGDPDLPSNKANYTREHKQAVRRARLHTNAPAAAIAGAMRALVAGGWHPSTVRLADLDTDPDLLWAGGMPYDLRASSNGPTFAQVDPNIPHLVSAGVAPDLRPTPHWDALLAAVWPDPDIRAWALRVLSIAVTGHPDAALPILLGPGGSGKTSTIELIMSVLGSYAHAANPKLLSGEASHDSIVFALKGRRLSFIDEGPRDGRWAQERLKQLTGGAALTGNAMNQNPITFKPTHTLILTANTEPTLTDEAIRRRVRLIPCEGDPDQVRAARAAVTPPVWAAEAPGVLAALMREAAAWLADPDTALTAAAPPAIRDRAVEIATQQDPVREWVDTCTVPADPGTPGRALYTSFARWHQDHPLYRRKSVPTENAFGRTLTEMGYATAKVSHKWYRPLSVLSGPAGVAPWEPIPDAHMTRGSAPETASQAPTSPDSGLGGGLGADWGGSAGQSAPSDNPRSTPVFSSSGADGADYYPINASEDDEEHVQRHAEERVTPIRHPSETAEKTGIDLQKQRGADSAEAIRPTLAQAADHSKSCKAVSPSQKVTNSDVARRANEAKISKAEARAQLKAEQRTAAIREAAGEVLPLPAVVDRAGNVLPVSVGQAGDVVHAAIGRSRALTVDVETSGYPIGHVHYELRSVQLGDATAAVVYHPVEHADEIRALLGAAPALHAHSATADLVPLAHAGLIDPDAGWSRMHDTVIPAKLADPASTGSDPGLKKLAQAVLGDAAVAPAAEAGRDALFKAGRWLKETKADTPVEKSGWAQVETRSTTMLRYAASDVLDTAALARALPRPASGVYERERLVQTMTARVAHAGVRLDAAHIAELAARHIARRAEAAGRVRWFGIDNPGSDPQVGKVATELGAALPKTATGRPSVAVGVLEPLKDSDGPIGELVRAVLDYRHHDTVIGLFLDPYRLLCERGDGRARPTVYTLGTDTGRMCLPTEHRLVTPTGYVKADNVRPGMQTLDAAGQWVRVTAVHRYEDQPVQTLSNRGVELAGTPEHRWVTSVGHGTAVKAGAAPRVLRRWDERPRLRVHLAPDVEPFDFSTREIPAETDGQRFAALIGMLVTDGRLVDDGPGVGLRGYVYQTERKFYREFRRVIPDQAVMYDRLTAGDHHEIRISARWLRPLLDVAGLGGLPTGRTLKDSPALHGWIARLPVDELRAFFAACWLADGTVGRTSMSCGSANLREVLTLAAYRLGVVAYVANHGRGGWSTTDRLGLQFRLPVVTTRKSQRGTTRADVWCVTTETGTFTAVNPHGTVYLTGNSCTRPNLQQLPREGGVRACITADPGQLMIGADFSGVEIRVAAALSQDPTLLRFLAEGRDLHGEIALQVWGPDPEATTKAGGVPTAKKAHRYTAKRATFGRIYGGGVSTLAAQTGQTIAMTQTVVDTLDALTPQLSAWSQSVRDAVKRGQTQFPSYSGRIIHLPREYPHKGPNYCIQGTAREVLVDALVKWRDTRWGTCTLLPIHDELDVFVPAEEAEEATRELVRCMEMDLLGVNIVADPSPPAFAWADSA